MIKPNHQIFKYYFEFIKERIDIFWNKFEDKKNIKTNNEIFLNNKFTNVYRILDRVSQYLVRNVIYQWNYKSEDILFRILLFKIFNKIDTWEYITKTIWEITLKSFNSSMFTKILDERKKENTIFNWAYIMTWYHSKYQSFKSKHEVRLNVIQKEFIENNLFTKILEEKSFEWVYNLLRNTPLIGDFLAYQYAIDFNYSDIINFDENSFVKAWIWAQRWIKKCFLDYNWKFESAIIYTQENFNKLCDQYEIKTIKLLQWRQPTLIDLQNCFCETDKYLRKKVPNLKVWNTRIKQLYKENKEKIEFFFPPKWWIKLQKFS